MTLLCASQTGYQNLCQLITRFKMREATKAEGAATLDDLEEFSCGLICLTGGEEGPLAAALARGGERAARQSLDRLASIYGHGNLYVELQRHQEREEECRNLSLLDVAAGLGLPVIATNGVRYAAAKRPRTARSVHGRSATTLRLIRQGGCSRSIPCGLCVRRVEMAALFRDIPEAVANTRIVSDRGLNSRSTIWATSFLIIPCPMAKPWTAFCANASTKACASATAPQSSGICSTRLRAQVEHELALIAKLGFAGYFLIVWDIIRYASGNGILVQGRGSAANSAVCYALEITAVDPVGMELLFERFLSESRGEWPDIDLDLPSERSTRTGHPACL